MSKAKNTSLSEIVSQVENRAKKWSPELKGQLGLNPYEKAKNIREGHLFAAWDDGYAAGLADGARRERRAFTRLIDKLIGDHVIEEREAHDALYDWLSARSKKATKGR